MSRLLRARARVEAWILRQRILRGGRQRGLRPVGQDGALLQLRGEWLGVVLELLAPEGAGGQAESFEIILSGEGAPRVVVPLSFDLEQVSLRSGEPAFGLALFGAPLRRMLAGARLARIEGSRLSLSWDPPRSTAQVIDALDQTLALWRAIGELPDPAERLYQNVRSDPSPQMRAQSLNVLGQQFEGTETFRRALTAAALDSDPEVRLFVARRAPPEEATTHLIGLAIDHQLGAGLRARAIESLPLAGPELMKSTRAALFMLVRDRDVGVSVAAIGALSRLAPDQMVERLSALAPDALRVEARAIATVLGRSGKPEAEPALLVLLARTNDPQLLLLVLDGLREVGGAKAIEAIEALRSSSTGLGAAEARAESALLTIKKRLLGGSG